MKKSKRDKITVVVVLLCLLTMVGAVYSCFGEVHKNLRIEMQDTLREMAEQNKAAVQRAIELGEPFGVYLPEWFEEFLNSQAFGGKGYSCIVKADGSVIAHSIDSPIYGEDNFLECLTKDGKGTFTGAKELTDAFQAGQSGMGAFELNGVQDFYYMPLKSDDTQVQWYMITVVPEEVLAERMQPIMSNVEQMLIIIMIIVVCGVSIFLLTYQIKRKELLKLAYTDSLTGADNFAFFQKKIMRKKDIHGYIIAMDLSDFKIINNTCGVETGDKVLAQLWRVLRSSIREDELAARIYADRFILFFVEEDRERVKERLDNLVVNIGKISEELNTPRVFPVFGVYETTNQESADTDYGNAVQAKHIVKGRRDRNYAFYEELDYQQVLEKRAIEDSFEQAIADKQFEIWYQPKFGVESGEVVGSEALVRWRMPDGTLFPPFKFIPVFEKNGMIPKLDEYVFRSVCIQQKEWERKGKKILPASVNISRVSLYYYNIVEKYKAISDENGVDAKYLHLEITESATIDNAEISSLIERFHQAGYEILLDDFGSGYSSLSTLNMMHFDTMKLDKSLIDYIGDENGEKLLHYITKLGQNLGLRITAEGVETKEQLEFLRNLKCDDIQGYYFSRPLKAEEFEKLLADAT